MTDKVEDSPSTNLKMDGEGLAAIIALIMNAANQGTAGSLASVLGNASQLAASVNSSQTSVKDNADINVPESMSGYVGLALNNATGHQARVQLMAEQVLQDAISDGKQIRQNAITQANNAVTDSVGQKHKRTTDQDIVADFLHFQGIRGESKAQDNIWNIDEQIAAASALYGALGRFLASTKVENPNG